MLLLAKQIVVLTVLIFAGYVSARFVTSFTWGSAAWALVVLSATLPWLFTPAWYLPWIRSLRMPSWLVSLLPTVVTYLFVVYHYSVTSFSSVFLTATLCFVPAVGSWLLSLNAMRHIQQEKPRKTAIDKRQDLTNV